MSSSKSKSFPGHDLLDAALSLQITIERAQKTKGLLALRHLKAGAAEAARQTTTWSLSSLPPLPARRPNSDSRYRPRSTRKADRCANDIRSQAIDSSLRDLAKIREFAPKVDLPTSAGRGAGAPGAVDDQDGPRKFWQKVVILSSWPLPRRRRADDLRNAVVRLRLLRIWGSQLPARAQDIAERIVKSLNGAGLFGSEMGDVYLGRRCVPVSFSFSRRHTNYAILASKLRGRILVNEIAPRPDNTGIISAPFYPTPSAGPHSKHPPPRCSICSAHRTKCPGSSILHSLRWISVVIMAINELRSHGHVLHSRSTGGIGPSVGREYARVTTTSACPLFITIYLSIYNIFNAHKCVRVSFKYEGRPGVRCPGHWYSRNHSELQQKRWRPRQIQYSKKEQILTTITKEAYPRER